MTRLAALAALLLLACTHVSSAAETTFSEEVPLWPEDSQVLKVGIRELAKERNAITHPSFLVYRPQKAPSVHAAILVFPGGGYKSVAIGPQSTLGLYGSDVCKWLTDAGITCILVKYRVPNTGCNWNKETKRHEQPNVPMALQDAQRALSLVRFNAARYDLDPAKIGVMGFSAGGNLAVLSSTAFKSRVYAPIDEADHVSIRPDFAIPVYPGHLTMEHKNKTPKAVAAQELNTDVVVSKDVPTTLLVHAKDDPTDPYYYSEVYARELRKVGVDVQVNLYETGGHAFGVRKQGADTDWWMDDAIRWLKKIEVL
ncbi:alpha/beta hydrolase [uncultured Stenotrophomonas sp.]|uniref:alpha/beta hydrolase n=1 Tax=uncultured Stenotrophomonas sp. TaxID=165438 RepID=UPI0028E55C1E|nr:alpha/beta hydrolase [uncultured Stenotrophomonas sp.]